MLSKSDIVGPSLSRMIVASASSDSNSALFSNLTVSVFSPSDPVKVYVGLQQYVLAAPQPPLANVSAPKFIASSVPSPQTST